MNDKADHNGFGAVEEPENDILAVLPKDPAWTLPSPGVAGWIESECDGSEGRYPLNLVEVEVMVEELAVEELMFEELVEQDRGGGGPW